MKIQDIPGATPLDDETLRGLIPGLTLTGSWMNLRRPISRGPFCGPNPAGL